GRAPHRARPPTAHVLVGRLVDERGLDVERVEIDPGALRAGVRDRALDELFDDGRSALARELQELERLAGLTASDEIDHDTSFARTNPREAGNRLADHFQRPFGVVVPRGDRWGGLGAVTGA